MSRRRRGSAVAATLALLVSGGAVAAADALLTLPGGERTEPRVVPALSASVRLACPAAPQPGAVGAGTDQQFTGQPVATTSRIRAVAATATTGGLQLLPLTGAQGQPTLAAPVVAGDGTGDLLARADAAAPVLVLGAPVRQDTSPDPAALQSALTTAGDLRGLSAGACSPAAAQSWLVGGGVEVGRSTRLLLSNPGATPAVVDVVLLSGTGRQVPAAGQGLLVPPGEVVELLVEGLTAVDPLLAVGVSASGGLVAASLVDSAVRGVTPAGVDVVTPSPAGTRHVLAGVPAGVDRAVLRLAVPGDAPAVVGWRIEGASGPLSGDVAAATTVPAGSVVDVPLGAVEAGPASVLVESDVPVLTSVQVVRAGPAESFGAEDRAWVPSAPAVTGTALLPLPGDDVAAALVLSAGAGDGGTAAAPVRVRVVPVLAGGAAGQAVPLTVAPGTTSTLPAEALAGAVAVRIEVGSGSVHAAAVLTASSTPDAASADLVSVVAVPAPVPPPGVVTVRNPPAGTWP